jgi:hypothetical protein
MWFRRLTQLALCALATGVPVSLLAQGPKVALDSRVVSDRWETVSSEADSDVDLSRTALARGRYAVLIDLDHNEISFRKGDQILWTAPIGTGTGLRMEKGDQSWDFSTPNGIFHVQFKEENPVWIAPDWFFLENGLPVPPPNDRKRYFPGGLGSAAVYIDHDLAIHGTDKPELLGQRVSHGCIRLSNKDALRLFHNVQVGTEVIIVGGRDVAREAKEAAARGNTFDPSPKKQPKDPVLEGWKAMDTEDLRITLDNELWLDAELTRWPEVASILLDRGLKSNDDEALDALFSMAGNLPNARIEREYSTFLADAYARNPMRTVDALGNLDRQTRRQAAAAIVTATMELFNGDFDAPTAPWPTRRIPGTAREAVSSTGWRALASAESDFRSHGERQSI